MERPSSGWSKSATTSTRGGESCRTLLSNSGPVTRSLNVWERRSRCTRPGGSGPFAFDQLRARNRGHAPSRKDER